MTLEELKIKAFEIRRKIDILEQQRAQLIQEYNNVCLEINKIEYDEKVSNDNGKVSNKIIAHK